MPPNTPVLNRAHVNFAAYQSQLVDHIRQQFEHNKQQWDLNLETRVQRHQEALHTDGRGTPSIIRTPTKRKSCSSHGTGDLNVDVELSDCVDYMGGAKKFIVRVDLSCFSPDDPVVVRTLENAIMVCGEHTDRHPLDSCRSQVKMIELPAFVDPNTLRTSTTRDRTLVIEAPICYHAGNASTTRDVTLVVEAPMLPCR